MTPTQVHEVRQVLAMLNRRIATDANKDPEVWQAVQAMEAAYRGYQKAYRDHVRRQQQEVFTALVDDASYEPFRQSWQSAGVSESTCAVARSYLLDSYFDQLTWEIETPPYRLGQLGVRHMFFRPPST